MRRARELAVSGVHINTLSIVPALVAEGYWNADEVLTEPLVRADLNAICAQHWRAPSTKVDVSLADEPEVPSPDSSARGLP